MKYRFNPEEQTYTFENGDSIDLKITNPVVARFMHYMGDRQDTITRDGDYYIFPDDSQWETLCEAYRIEQEAAHRPLTPVQSAWERFRSRNQVSV